MLAAIPIRQRGSDDCYVERGWPHGEQWRPVHGGSPAEQLDAGHGGSGGLDARQLPRQEPYGNKSTGANVAARECTDATRPALKPRGALECTPQRKPRERGDLPRRKRLFSTSSTCELLPAIDSIDVLIVLGSEPRCMNYNPYTYRVPYTIERLMYIFPSCE